MTGFFERLNQIIDLLHNERRVTYRTLVREFELNEETLEAIQYELVVGKRLAVDENGEVLVWVGHSVDRTVVSGEEELSNSGIAARTVPAVSVTNGVSPPMVSAPKSEAERRQLTVMFVDMVGSTSLSGQLDPEDMREVMLSYQNAVAGEINRYEGHVAKFMGDGVLAYFGWPIAHEAEAERAVRAGLAATAAVAELSTPDGIALASRVGIATGMVVVGDLIGEGAAQEEAVVGETPNLAARLEGIAAPGHLAISPGTHRLVDGLFEFETLGEHTLKGISEPVEVWSVIGELSEDDISTAEQYASRTPLVGRLEETGMLTRAWDGAREGRGQFVLIQGEAGVGKSRLIDMLRDSVVDQAHVWISVRASPYHTASPLHPVAEQVKRAIDWRASDSVETRLVKLERAMNEQTDFSLDELVPLFASLLSLDLPEGRYSPLNMTPNRQRQATLDAVSSWVLGMTEKSPVLMVWEDLHWADPTTVELLGLMLDQAPTVPILMVGTHRPDFVPPWPTRAHVTPITLSRLERPEVEAIATHLAGGKSLPSLVVDHIVSKGDGVPLYIEELTKAILESELLVEETDRFVLGGRLDEMQIPETLQDSLMARLDRAPLARELAQIGSVIGREFSFEMLEIVASQEPGVLQDGLDQLVSNELVYQRGRGRRARYMFKHALIQDAAYQSLLKRARQQHHQQVADLMLSSYSDLAESQPELVAYHLSHAGAAEKSVMYWQAAGRNALQGSADVEAISHLQRGLSELSDLPSSPERDRTELELLTALGPALIAVKGFGSDSVRDTYSRAHAVCRRVGSPAEEFPVLRGLLNSTFFSAHLDEALEQGRALLKVSHELGDDALEVEARRVAASVSFMRGDFVESVEHAEVGLDLYDLERHQGLAFVYGADPQVVCGLYGALSMWALGQPDRAEATMHTAVESAKALAHGHTLAFALCYRAMLDQLCRNVVVAQVNAEEAVNEAAKGSIQQWQDWGRVVRGWAQAMEGDLDNGLALLDQGLDEWRGRHPLIVPWFLGQRAEILCEMQNFDRAFEVTRSAIAVAEEGPQGMYLAELYRLQGEILLELSSPDTEAAESALLRSIEVARSQHAKGFELRALTSLVRFRNGRDDELESRTWLADCYGSFTENVDSADLRRAKSLLDGRPVAVHS